jgi:hypothetical protein
LGASNSNGINGSQNQLVFSGVRVAQSFVFCAVVCRPLFVLFSFSFGRCVFYNSDKYQLFFLFMLITNKGSSYKIFKLMDFIIGDVVQIGTSVRGGKK